LHNYSSVGVTHLIEAPFFSFLFVFLFWSSNWCIFLPAYALKCPICLMSVLALDLYISHVKFAKIKIEFHKLSSIFILSLLCVFFGGGVLFGAGLLRTRDY